MMKPYKYLMTGLPILATSLFSMAESTSITELDEISVIATTPQLAGSSVGFYSQISDNLVEKQKLQSRSATLGNALANELGVHSNPFGGGASAPIIRGQEGVRVKLLQNGLDVVDMSTISPDHAVAADTLLAEQVELVRGASTLLYSTASATGVVNVVDKRIPTQMPKKNYEGEIFTRFDTASKEKTATVGLTFKLTPHLALRLEGLTRQADNYRVPQFKPGDEVINFLPDSHNRSKVGTIGLSWIKDQSYLGIAYSERHDRYGLPGHNHKFDNCKGHIVDPSAAGLTRRGYLIPYPHLAEDADLIYPHFDGCLSATGSDHPHSHDNPFGNNDHDHSHAGPWVELQSKRVDVRAQWHSPTKWLEKIRASFAYADYLHYERDAGKSGATKTDRDFYKDKLQKIADKNAGKASGIFKNRGYNAKLEFYHQPVAGLSGVVGVQYSELKSAVVSPLASALQHQNNLISNTNKLFSLFAVENYAYKNFVFEIGARLDKQRIPIRYDKQLLENAKQEPKNQEEEADLSTYKQTALSYSGSIEWLFTANHRLALTYSRNERLPTPMELYYQGKHLATNSFEYGNKNLRKESSDNIELALAYNSDKWDYRISLYQNKFNNYIYNENLRRDGNLFVRRYIQGKAKFHGIEAEISYKPTPDYKITLFGDYVKGKLFDLPKQYGDKIYKPSHIQMDDEGFYSLEYVSTGRETVERPNRYAPRLPPARLGLRLNGEFTENFSGFLEYTYVFPQKKTATSLSVKKYNPDYYRNDDDDDEDDELSLTAEEIARYNPHNYDLEEVEFELKQLEKELRGKNAPPPLIKETIHEDKSRGYHALNLGLRYQGKTRHFDYAINFNVNNLLNQRIYIHTSHLPYVPQMGRNYSLGLEVKF